MGAGPDAVGPRRDEQRRPRCFPVTLTLKNMLNIGDTYTRISTIVPDTHFDTDPEFLIEQ